MCRGSSLSLRLFVSELRDPTWSLTPLCMKSLRRRISKHRGTPRDRLALGSCLGWPVGISPTFARIGRPLPILFIKIINSRTLNWENAEFSLVLLDNY